MAKRMQSPDPRGYRECRFWEEYAAQQSVAANKNKGDKEMKMKRVKKALSLFLCMVLIVAMALFTTGCNDKAAKETTAETTAAAVTVLGEGSKSFEFSVADLEGNETWFEIHTDEETVGAALLAVELISGDEGPYGLYVKEVNGMTADYDKDKTYWAFYVNDEYGTSGVDTTAIEEGDVYSFRMAK